MSFWPTTTMTTTTTTTTTTTITESEEGSEHVPEMFFSKKKKRANSRSSLERADVLQGKLVGIAKTKVDLTSNGRQEEKEFGVARRNVKGEEGRGEGERGYRDENVDLVHVSLNQITMENENYGLFLECLNEEVAKFVECFEKSKSISMKSFFIDEAHITNEWLMSMVESWSPAKVFSSVGRSINADELNAQRETINGVRNDIFSLLLHPGFSSSNLTPLRILRIPQKWESRTRWQREVHDQYLCAYSEAASSSFFRRKEGGGLLLINDPCLLFLYDEEREKFRKEVTLTTDFDRLLKEYAEELKTDPSFVEYLKKAGGKAKDAKSKESRKKDRPAATEERKTQVTPSSNGGSCASASRGSEGRGDVGSRNPSPSTLSTTMTGKEFHDRTKKKKKRPSSAAIFSSVLQKSDPKKKCGGSLPENVTKTWLAATAANDGALRCVASQSSKRLIVAPQSADNLPSEMDANSGSKGKGEGDAKEKGENPKKKSKKSKTLRAIRSYSLGSPHMNSKSRAKARETPTNVFGENVV